DRTKDTPGIPRGERITVAGADEQSRWPQSMPIRSLWVSSGSSGNASAPLLAVELEFIGRHFDADDDDEIGARFAFRERDGLLQLLDGLAAGLVGRQVDGGVEAVARQNGLIGPRHGHEVVEPGLVLGARRTAAGDQLDLQIDLDGIVVV